MYLIWRNYIKPDIQHKKKFFNDKKNVKNFKKLVTPTLCEQLKEISKTQKYKKN